MHRLPVLLELHRSTPMHGLSQLIGAGVGLTTLPNHTESDQQSAAARCTLTDAGQTSAARQPSGRCALAQVLATRVGRLDALIAGVSERAARVASRARIAAVGRSGSGANHHARAYTNMHIGFNDTTIRGLLVQESPPFADVHPGALQLQAYRPHCSCTQMLPCWFELHRSPLAHGLMHTALPLPTSDRDM
jgi:hypothetical protein